MIDQPRGASQFQSRHTRHKRHENHRLDAPSLTTLRGLDPLLVCQLVLTPRKCGSRHKRRREHGDDVFARPLLRHRHPLPPVHCARPPRRRSTCLPSSTGRPGRLSSLTPREIPPTCRSSTNLSRSPTLSPGRLATSSPPLATSPRTSRDSVNLQSRAARRDTVARLSRNKPRTSTSP